MTALRPRRTSHRGSVVAAGLAVDTHLTGEDEARRRILRLPARDLAVFRVGDVLAVRFPAPVRLDAADAPGAPLLRYGRLLSPAPLAGDEREAVAGHGGDAEDILVTVAGGAALAVPLTPELRVDACAWIDVSAFAVVTDVQALGSPAPEPGPAIAAGAATVRQSFGIAPLGGEAREMREALRRPDGRGALPGLLQSILAALRSGLRGGASGPAPAATGAPPSRQGVGRRGLAALRRILEALRWGRRSPPAAAGPGTPAVPRPETRPGLLGALRDVLARAAWSSQIGRLLGSRLANHLSRVLHMLDAGDWDNAFRNAVPLSDDAVSRTPRPPPLGLPAPRANLAINLRVRQANTGFDVRREVFGLLRERYRRAFERLDAQGDVDRAAFVLAELLNAHEEAVVYLEKHGRLRLAAELAEARGLAPGLVIRLWFLAGDRGRSVLIARLTGAFADAVLRLEKSNSRQENEQAGVLRLMWADALASAGDYAGAVDAAWPVTAARGLMRAFIDRAIAVGGPVGARMLVRKIILAPEAFEGLREQALALLAGDGEECDAAVHAFAHELTVTEPTPETRTLAQPVARRLFGNAGIALAGAVRDTLLAMTTAEFAADVRAWQQRRAGSPAARQPVALHLRPEPLDIHLQRAAASGLPVTDAAALPGGGTLVAAGDAGVFVLSGDGRVSTRFAEPAHDIVISDRGDRAILVARRGELRRISRLDLATRRLQPWCEARFTRCAADFDGSMWFVACDDTLYAVDATATGWTHLWKVAEPGAAISIVARDAWWMSALFFKKTSYEAWTFELPSITMRRRTPIAAYDDKMVTAIGAGLDPQGTVVGCPVSPLTAPWLVTDQGGRWHDLPIVMTAGLRDVAMSTGWMALYAEERQGAQARYRTVIHLLDAGNRILRLRIAIDGDGLVRPRIRGDRLVLFDDSGRIVTVSLTSGAVLHDNCLKP